MKKLMVRGSAVVASVAAMFSGAANAAIDLTGVDTAITAATTSGETTGGYVIAAVAALVVIGVIISVVRKMG